jgi:hypothetical protein
LFPLASPAPVSYADHIADGAGSAIDGASNDGLYSAQLFHGQILERHEHHEDFDVVHKRAMLGTF